MLKTTQFTQIPVGSSFKGVSVFNLCCLQNIYVRKIEYKVRKIDRKMEKGKKRDKGRERGKMMDKEN